MKSAVVLGVLVAVVGVAYLLMTSRVRAKPGDGENAATQGNSAHTGDNPPDANAAGANATEPNVKKGDTKMVPVYVFNKQGKLVGPVDSPKVELTPAEWKVKLTPEQFKVLRNEGTEPAFCGNLTDNKLEGVYTCAGCGLPLFASDSKFHSGTGWPSFFQPIGKGNVTEHVDNSYGMARTEIVCSRCGGHLGHVFDDGPKPTGLRFCMNSAALNFTGKEKLASLADPAAEAVVKSSDAAKPHDAAKETEDKTSVSGSSNGGGETATAVFAGGCFWCTEAVFQELKGVTDVEAGYSGGSKDTANYETVSTGRTGHAESIKITYDPSKITYDKLLTVFFDAHDPTQLNGQGADHGTQYRSAIFYGDDTQKKAAEAKIKQLTAAKVYDDPIVTTLEPLKAFYPAEGYHQNYAHNNPDQPYIRAESFPKVCRIRDKHPELVKKSTAVEK